MRLALLGSDHELQTLLRDLPAEHTIVAAFDAAEHELPLAALMPHVERGDRWESLLIRDDVDLVIVASPLHLRMASDGLDPQVRRIDQLKKLAQAGVNLLVSHPGAELLDAYEIEMLRREGGGLIDVWYPGYAHPAWETISPSAIGRAPGGVIFRWSRRVASRSKADILAALARDLLRMEGAIGVPKKVTALAGARADDFNVPDWSRLSVQISTADGSLVRWDLAPAEQSAEWEIAMEQGGKTETFEISCGAQSHDWDHTSELQERLTRAASAIRHRDSQPSEVRGRQFLMACRSLEALAAVEKSLQRGRTIEVAQSEQSEEHNFKGVMASAGCLLLFLILFAVFVVALVEGLRLPLRESPIWRLWPLGLILPLALFLGMQFLQTVIRKPESR